MTDPGLTRRLRQQSHRSGLAVGLSMALAIAVCFGGFTWLYVQLDPWVRDFAGVEPAPTATARSSASNSNQDEEEQPVDEEVAEPDPTETPESEEANQPDIEPVDNEDNNDFKPDYQVIALEAVNLRGGPGVNFDIVTSLGPGTQLEYMDDREASSNPDADGDTEWLQFQTEDGLEGWIRQIDVGET